MEDLLLSIACWALILALLFLGLWYQGIARSPFSLLRKRLLSTLLLEHIRALVRLGLPLTQGLACCGDRLSESSKKDLGALEVGIARDGLLLGDALASVPHLVSPAEAEVLRISEMTGSLEQGLDLIVRERRRFTDLRNWMYGTFIYAAALVLVAIVILSFLFIFIIPRFIRMFTEMNVGLPAMTRGLISGAPFLARSWVAGVAVVLAVLLIIRFRPHRPAHRAEGSRRKYFEYVTQLPNYLLPFTRRALLGEFCLELSMLTKVGVPAHRALRLLADGTMNPWFCARIRSAADLCEAGVPLPAALDETGIDRRAAWFVRAAPNPTALSEALARLAEDYRSRTSVATAVLGRLLPPVVVLCVGFGVGFVVISMFLPLIKLTASLGG